MTKLLGISGSLRRESTNTKLVHAAARAFAPDHFEMADLRLPLFDEDLEAKGQPPAVAALCEKILWADAIVISTPEYNGAPPGLLKNALDWVSRPKPMPTAGKPVAVVSAAAGIAGGQRSKSALYLMLLPFGMHRVHAPEVNLGQSGRKFDEAGNLTDEMAVKLLGDLMGALKAAI
ncbi:NAD(P)H-dependent FMN reductase [Paralimibaculum aggregatum]|uniref:NAD(P)H-dependent FMN reductase n=1 Tax=Paralimibaculum aggregatum TaxID=3036245 RepID=A0ABQ6LLY4_9RHOB|nr:NAD(P)H-dependent oxidoreductase [Limibaculum sp. NKW23]GMG83300.1 NAD(P)H-dependent FMN reductase [Limibaculum sp. NKW23]